MALLSAEAAVTAAVPAEADLIDRARRMDQGAWDALYTTHYPAIYRYCILRLHQHEAAEDLAAEVFLEAVRGIRRYRYRGTPFRAWLYRIAHNLTADERKRRARLGAVDDREAPDAGVPDFADGLAERGAILQALRSLTDDQQQVVILRFIEGLSLAETAGVMRRPAGAIKSLQHRAMQRLRRLLEGEVG